jgi:hypothetical protein
LSGLASNYSSPDLHLLVVRITGVSCWYQALLYETGSCCYLCLGWPQTFDLPACFSKELGLQACTTTPGYNFLNDLFFFLLERHLIC